MTLLYLLDRLSGVVVFIIRMGRQYGASPDGRRHETEAAGFVQRGAAVCLRCRKVRPVDRRPAIGRRSGDRYIERR
jgi:hypothetical protein